MLASLMLLLLLLGLLPVVRMIAPSARGIDSDACPDKSEARILFEILMCSCNKILQKASDLVAIPLFGRRDTSLSFRGMSAAEALGVKLSQVRVRETHNFDYSPYLSSRMKLFWVCCDHDHTCNTVDKGVTPVGAATAAAVAAVIWLSRVYPPPVV